MKKEALISKGDVFALQELLCSVTEELAKLTREGNIKISLCAVSDNDYSKAQRGASHVWFAQVAKCLNDAGFYRVVKTVRSAPFNASDFVNYQTKNELIAAFEQWYNESFVEIDWCGVSVKEFIWRPIMSALAGVSSTEEQKSVDPSKVYMHISRHFSSTKGITLPPWPCRHAQADAAIMTATSA